MIIKRMELTEIQRGIYFDCQIDNPVSYNIFAPILFENLQERYFEDAFTVLIGEQEALRSSLEIVNDLPVLAIYDRIDFKMTRQDLSGRHNQAELVDSIIKEEIGQGFDLTRAPLFRARLITLGSNKHLFLICINHLICDGVSLEIFKKKILKYYRRLADHQAIVLRQDAGFAEFMSRENLKLSRGAYQKQRDFWIKKMQGAEPLVLQADYAAKQKNDDLGREKRFVIPRELMIAANELAMEQEATVFMFFLAVFGLLLNQYTRNEDIVFASPFSYRPSMDFEETIGCFVYMLPIRLNIGDRTPFTIILQQVVQEVIDTYKQIGYPNNLIMRDSRLVPMPGAPSIFDVSFVYDVYEDTGESGVKTRVLDQDVVTFPGNLMVILNKTPEQDLLKIQYKRGIFADETIEAIGNRFLKLLETVVARVDIPIEMIDLVSDNEKRLILNEFNSTAFFPYQPRTIIDIFHEKVSRHPERIALIEGARTETYTSVNAKANRLAARILNYKKRANEAVGVQLARSVDLVICLLGILKAGCLYVPIDPAYPPVRKEFIFEDADISLFITTSDLPREAGWKIECLFVDDPETYTGDSACPGEAGDPFHLAYIMYTSGSTGKPKGVMIENHSVVNTLLDLERRFPLEENDIFMLKTAFTFDVSVTELFGWFMGEGVLFILEPEAEKNPDFILDQIAEYRITHINFVPSMFRLFLELFEQKSNISKLSSLKWIFIGGEAVTPDILRKFYSLETKIRLENVYGPTECTIWASHYSLKDYREGVNIPIGRPLNEIRWYITGKNQRLQPIGVPGELCLSGVGLARGYLNRDELTGEKFIPNPFYREGTDPGYFRVMYRTGDLARWLPDGTIEFLDRIDFQVKVRGRRLELGEIENVLAMHEDIVQAVVVVKKDAGKPSVLCAYYLSDAEIATAKLRDHLASVLPAYMIPSFFIHKKELPLNSSGKINRNVLIADTDYLKQTSSGYVAPGTNLEDKIAAVWRETLSIPKVGIDDNFFEIGGHSLSLIQVHNKLKKVLNRDFSITLLFQVPTIRLLAESFSKDEPYAIINRKTYFQRSGNIRRQDIAIIGMAVRAPGARDIRQFWHNLKSGTESIYFYSDTELKALGIPLEILNSPNYVTAKGRVDDIDYFDPGFFEYTPGEVRMMSPQLRLLYLGTWEALEDAGYFPDANSARIGLFIGGSDDFEWYRKALLGKHGYGDKYQAFTLSTNHFLATRLAYKLDIKGPVFSALTGCSTTLVTPHLACQSLILGECDLAVAGGITIELPNEGGYIYEEGMMFSPDGHCRPFDAEAKGTVFSNGLGLLVLKRLDDALRDDDHIYAVIKGSAINNDGRQKVGFAAPSVDGQAAVIQEAYRVAGVDPETISYIEAHGTGTTLGDPIEVESLTRAFATGKKQYCLLGSVKGNVGHTDTAAGAVGLAKVALSLQHRYLPGTVNYREPNPKIDFPHTPFRVNAEGEEWKHEAVNGGVLRAGINSFGVGGTNAHMVLEEPPAARPSSPAEKINLLLFSAKSVSALQETSGRILNHLFKNPGNLSDVTWTLQTGRKPFSQRKFLVVDEKFYDSPEQMSRKLQEAALFKAPVSKRNIYFLFPGQGSQYQGMGRGLYESADGSRLARIFRHYVDRVFSLLAEEERRELIQIIYGNENPQQINQTEYSQFSIFTSSYALARTFMELGIVPAGMIGHSIGEMVAAAVAGVFELKDAVEIVRLRGRIMQKQEPGVMMAIMAPAREVEKALPPDVWLALDNTTNSCVVGGREDTITRFEETCALLGWKALRVKTSHAFHTPMMEEAAQEFGEKLSAYTMKNPRIPILSNISGGWIRENEMTDPDYWARHIRRPVNFTRSLAEILKTETAVFIEAGAGHTLSSFARNHAAKKPAQIFTNLIRHPRVVKDDLEYLTEKLGELWGAGVDIDWYALKGETVRKRLSLPTYVFDKVHFPIEVAFDLQPAGAGEEWTGAPEYELAPASAGTSPREPADLAASVVEAYKAVFGFSTIEAGQDFFALGGDSLKAVSLAAALKNLSGVKVDISDLFKYSTPGSLTAYLAENTETGQQHVAVKPVALKAFYPLSSAQNRMYALYLLDQDNTAYNLPSVTVIRGSLDRERLTRALEKLAVRHESLRTSFEIRGNQPVQIIHRDVKVPLTCCEKSVSGDDDICRLIDDFVKPFSLEKTPLFRVELVKTGTDNYLLLFDLHHIIADGTSMEIITRDFNELYFGELPPLKIQYRDFAVWQNDFLKSQEIMEQRNFWLNQLGDELPVIQLPTDFKRPPVKNFQGSRVYFSLDLELYKALIDLAHESETTLFMLLFAAWNVLLARYSGQEDLIIGTPVAGRTQEEIRETVGMFVNMLAMRNRPEHGKRFGDFLQEVKENALAAFKNQDYQFDILVEQLNLKREMNRNALFDICFDFQNMEFYDFEIGGLHFAPYQFETKTATYDLILTCQENKKEQVIEGFLEYATGLFEKETVERIIEHFRTLLSVITKEKDILLENISLVSPQERQKLMVQFNQTELAFDDSLLIQDMFEQNAAKFPRKTALVVSGGKALTYRELNEKANVLARHLIESGIGEDSLVGIMPRRDEQLFVALLGVLKAGGAYVPIDPDFPRERISYMLCESDVSVLICPREFQGNVDFDGIMIDGSELVSSREKRNNPSRRGSKDSLACVIFTSGSTGKPKGVMINQSSLVNFVHDIKKREIFQTPEDRIICVTTLSFDIFGFESLVPLCTGHSVYLADKSEQLDPALASLRIAEHKVTHILSTVSRIKAFVENPEFGQALQQLECILSGGENYPVPLLNELQKKTRARLFNMYGPTETTIWSTTKDLTTSESVNIGQPIANTRVYITNTAGKLQPIGIFGELCVAGKGLARGYWKKPEETRNKFIEFPELPGTTIYRTGDRARFLANGEIELKGRLDSQIKIRGYRIEPDEIEKVVQGHESLRQAVLIAVDDKRNNKQLALYYCLKKEAAHPAADSVWLRNWLKEKLPRYMIPSYFVPLDEMPTLPNGKINRKGLPALQEQNDTAETWFQPPTSKLEKELLEVWKEVLNIDRISLQDNFFDVGGNSLGLILINNKLNALMGRPVPLMQLFKYPTIESLVRSLDVPGGPKKAALSPAQEATRNQDREPDGIAVIGLAGKFPGAADVDSFWENLVAGVESITQFTDRELEQSGIDERTLSSPNYVKAKGFLEGIEYFDADFFDYSRNEANNMDPQIRVLTQSVWEVLENAGYNPSLYPGRIGLFAGSGSNLPWMSRFIGAQHDVLNAFEALTLNEKDFLTTRISYKLNLKGPSLNVQTACSTSLVAIHQALQSLRRGESDMAIAGGVSISYPRKEGYLWHEGMIFSRDGHCRPFAKNSTGTISGNGCGVVLLKPLATALQDGDHIYAVIKGSAINNDGLDKIGYTAPSITGQERVIETALNEAGVPAETISYLEAHGTGTKLGDPIEVEALKQAWKTDRKGFCAIGSVKANIGHLDSAAGVAGFIKVVLSLYHRQFPPLINYQDSNPEIDFTDSPFYINTETRQITDTDQILRAGVSSFGIGGTNVHVILEQAPQAPESSPPEAVNLLLFSARSRSAVTNTSEAILGYLQEHPQINLSDAAWTLQAGRKHFEYRKALVVKGAALPAAEAALGDFREASSRKIPDIGRPVIFLFPGADCWYRGMGRELYSVSGQTAVASIFKRHIDQVLSCLAAEERRALTEELLEKEPPVPGNREEARHLALFATEYALAGTLLEIGISPEGLLGQGIGEISACVVGGVLALEDALALVKTCGPVLQNQEPGLIAALMLDNRITGAAPVLKEKMAPYKLKQPGIPLVVNRGGSPGEPGCKLANSLRNLEDIMADTNSFFIKAGPGEGFTGFVKQPVSREAGTEIVYLVPPAPAKAEDLVHFNQALGQIWCAGIEIDWPVLKGDSIRQRLPLPTYVFERKYYENDVLLNAAELRETHPREQELAGPGSVELSPETVNQHLSGIWYEILGCDQVDSRDDFFASGGHSLKAITLAAQIQKVFGVEIPLAEIFAHSGFSQMAEWLMSNRRNQSFHQIRPVAKQSHYATSSAQKRMYAVNEFIEDGVPYNLAAVYMVEGVIDRERFQKVIDQLLLRHESFRTRFEMIGGEVVQIIEDELSSIARFETATEAGMEAAIEKLIQPFDLGKAPLLRVNLISLSEENHVLFIDMHHIISDQSSIAILLQEFSALYSGKSLPPLTLQYKDFAAWQNELFRSPEVEKQFAYWENELRGDIPVLNLLTDYNRPRVQSFQGDRFSFDFGAELSADINRLAKECGLTPYMIFIAALKLVLWKFTGQDDLIVGTGIAGRRHTDLASIVGMFVNTLAIRSQIDENLSIGEYLRYIKEKMVKAYENQDCQFEMLLERLGIKKDLGRNPLFDVVINYINMGTEELDLEGLSLTPWPVKQIDSKFDITWTIEARDNEYFADIEYATALFKRETIKALVDRLLIMLTSITSGLNLPLKEISLLSPAEKEWLVHDLNQAITDAPVDETIVQLFEKQVQLHGRNTAIVWENEELSYLELNRRANRLAERLREQNIQPGARVAILLERNPVQIVSILGILKCGGVYVPINLEYPDSRIQFMLEDSGSSLVLTHSWSLPRLGGAVPYLCLDRESDREQQTLGESGVFKNQAHQASADDEVYIIYTSGSTGTPKGTLITHRNVTRVVRNTNYITIEPEDRLLQLSNYAFDGSVFDIFGALLNGAGLVMIPGEVTIEIPRLTEVIAEKGITMFFITASLFNMLVDWDVTSLKNVRKILFGGEAASVSHVRKALDFLGPHRLINAYGPTETTVFACYYPVDRIEDDATLIPIGYPLSQTALYVLDRQGQLVPPKVPGELYIGGAGVSKGYLNRAELNEQKFVRLPFGSPGRVYRTGDLVSRLPGGEIGFLGRIDFQIKIRGFRVELGEIENHFKKIRGIKEIIIVALKDKTGSLYIAAYYTVDKKLEPAGGLNPARIRELLLGEIPDYMIPARMKKMESLPLNLNGKIDRKALPVIEEIRDTLTAADAPGTEAERILLEAMRNVLDNQSIGITDDFFQCGGQSLKAISLVHALSKAGIQIKVNEIFRHPTVEKLAALPELKSLHKKKTTAGENAPEEQDAETASDLIILNEWQIENLVDHVLSTSVSISKMIVSSNRIARFPLSPVQVFHTALGSNASGFTTRLNGPLDEPFVRKLLGKVIQQHQLLHCVVTEDHVLRWNEYDLSIFFPLIINHLSYLDLRQYTGPTKDLVREKLCAAVLLSLYRTGQLPWRLCCLRLNHDTHLIIWGFDHTAFDGMSAEVIRHQMEKEVSRFLEGDRAGERPQNEELPRKYQDYISLLALGPQSISEQEIIDRFSLTKWSENNLAFMENLATVPHRREVEIDINIPLADGKTQDPWHLAFDFVLKLLCGYTGLAEIPFTMVNYGRSYNNDDFYNCVGEFLDIIPLLASAGEGETNIPALLQKCRYHAINFLSLLFDAGLAKKFAQIANLLLPAYNTAGPLKEFVLFNFQGFVSREEKEAFEDSEEAAPGNNLARLLITANYDEENIYINLQCPDGLNLDIIKSIIQSFSKQKAIITANQQSKEGQYV